MIENELTRKLVPNEKNVKIVLDTVGYLRPNKKAQADYYTSLVTGGILSINECRMELGYPAIDGGDTPIIPYTDINQNKISNQKQEQTETQKDDENK